MRPCGSRAACGDAVDAVDAVTQRRPAGIQGPMPLAARLAVAAGYLASICWWAWLTTARTASSAASATPLTASLAFLLIG